MPHIYFRRFNHGRVGVEPRLFRPDFYVFNLFTATVYTYHFSTDTHLRHESEMKNPFYLFLTNFLSTLLASSTRTNLVLPDRPCPLTNQLGKLKLRTLLLIPLITAFGTSTKLFTKPPS
ncbi:unnamed protein product [Amoebophrya sp. A120]|nr:unnamed protein product [Amoebophrya sp. A120]|eukprot:GSA120T00023686001.1